MVSTARKSYNRFEFGNHGNKQNCIKIVFFMPMKKVSIKKTVFCKIIYDNCVSMATKSYDQLKFLNLVTMATTKIV